MCPCLWRKRFCFCFFPPIDTWTRISSLYPFLFLSLSLFLKNCYCLGMYGRVHMCCGAYVAVRGQLYEADFLLPPLHRLGSSDQIQVRWKYLYHWAVIPALPSFFFPIVHLQTVLKSTMWLMAQCYAILLCGILHVCLLVRLLSCSLH